MLKKPGDMTPVIDLTHEKGAGPVRSRRPVYVDLLPPCNNACPSGENIQFKRRLDMLVELGDDRCGVHATMPRPYRRHVLPRVTLVTGGRW